MLADTDAGSVITAAQSGARFGYRLVALQFALIPVLFLVQEMTARLGLATGRGHGALIRQVFGRWSALLSALTLFVACLGALITEFAGVAGAGALAGLPRAVSVGAVAVALVALMLSGGHRRVERVGIAIGALELLFIPADIIARPHLGAVVGGLAHPWSTNGGYLTLVAANVGSTVIPWMVFYQQGAVVDRGRRGRRLRAALRESRWDTVIGAVICQVVTVAILVASAATLGLRNAGASLNDIGDIAAGLAPFLGHTTAVVLFGAGMIGASVLAALVVCLAGAWGMSEVLGWRHSLNDPPRHAAGFYMLVAAGIATGAILVVLVPNLVNLSVGIQVMNACLLPIVLGFLLALERRALPAALRMRGTHRAITYAVTGLVIAFGLYTAVQTLAGPPA
ncbi:Mn2+/Fe2+ NRAMP family transporter [Streptacidiphilus sp. MAP12-20]|uniref:NRAMP family divalent metal transporter n=1 Tax=Streptacidiphilus sp. MAP12-20 TaxID=3156299 RepID=UPI003517E56E